MMYDKVLDKVEDLKYSMDCISLKIDSIKDELLRSSVPLVNSKQLEQKLALIEYWNPDNVRVNVNSFALCGFKFRGANYKQGDVVKLDPSLLYPTVNFKNGYIENGYTTNQWYAVFGILEDSKHYGSLVPVPFLRVKNKVENTLEFAECGMNGSVNVKKQYNFKDLINHEVLVINEAGKWSGLIKNIISNTVDTVTLNDVGNLQAGDFILIAPQKENYVYLGSFYVDNYATFNRADSGNGFVAMRAVSISNLNIAGDISVGVDIDFRTFISPLASGVFFYVYDTYTVSNTGAGYINFGTDVSHDIELVRINKTTSGADAFRYYCKIPFCMRQSTNIKSSGVANLATNRSVNIRGYIE